MLQFFYLCLLKLHHLLLHHSLLRIHYFQLVEFLGNHSHLQFLQFLHLTFQVLLPDIVLLLHRHFQVLALLNIVYIYFLIFLAFCKNILDVKLKLVYIDFLVLHSFWQVLLRDMVVVFYIIMLWLFHLRI